MHHLRLLLLASLCALPAFADARAEGPDPVQAEGPVSAPSEGPGAAAPLAFSDFYKRPVGPRGLEPGARLAALAGSRVELAGFLVQRPDPSGPLIVAPVPVVLGDEDESFADDLPASVAYLHPIDAQTAAALQACRGPVRVRGRLDLGRSAEPDGRQSFVRLQADAAWCLAARER